MCGLAAEANPAPQPGDVATTDGNVLAIDNKNTFPGMNNMTYSSGYAPTVANGAAHIVLPLYTVDPGGELMGEQLHVSFNLGDTESSPFQFLNYDETISLDKASGRYIIDKSFALAGRRVMGRYPLVVNVDGKKSDGTQFTQSFTVYVTITDGIDPNATPTPEPTPEIETPSEEPPVPEAKVLLNSYTVTPSPAVAGEEVLVSAEILNTSETQDISNVKVTVTGETTDLMPVDSTTSYYFKTIESGNSVWLDFKMKISPGVEPKPLRVLLSIKYEGNKATAYSAEENILIPVTQEIRLEYDEPQFPANVNAGDTQQVSMNVMNMGIGTVHNVRMEVVADALLPEKTAFIGNIASGEAKKGELYVFVGTKDMADGADVVEKYGDVSGKVVLTYEDENGQVFTEEFPFETTINPPVIMPEEPEEEEEKPKNQGQWWISIVVAGAVIAAIVIIRYVVKQKQKRQREADEAD
ncbi:MAG TPA: hypothetical protein DEB31_04755 [Clostridiales bacterium]|nr:hypothetical protein [Clostridiales bacterium]